MKKFIIFFLMTIFLLGNGYSYAEKSTPLLVNKLAVDRVDHVDGVDGMEHNNAVLHMTSPTSPITIGVNETVTVTSTITPPPSRNPVNSRNYRRTMIMVFKYDDDLGEYWFHYFGPWEYNNAIDQPIPVSYTFTEPGEYAIEIVFAHRERNSGSYSTHYTDNSILVTVRDTPPFETPVIAGEHSVCQGNTIQLSTQEQAGYTYQWLLGSNTIPGASNHTLDLPANLDPGNYDFSVRLMQGATIVATSDVHTLNVLANPTVNLSAARNNVCVDDNIVLTATPNPAEAPLGGTYIYQWTRNDTPLTGEGAPTGPIFSDGPMTAAGTYRYTVKVSYSYPGCSGVSTEVPVEVHNLAGVTMSGTTNSCDGNVNLTLEHFRSLSTVTWYEDNILVKGPDVITAPTTTLSRTGVSNGPHIYKVVVEAPAERGGCVEEVEKTVNVYQFSPFTLTADPSVNAACTGGQVTFTPNPAYDISDFDYTWAVDLHPTGDTDPTFTYTMETESVLIGLQLTHKTTGCMSLVQNFALTHLPDVAWEAPAFTYDPNRLNICEDHVWELTAHIDGTPTAYNYEWTRTGPEGSYEGPLAEITHVVRHDPNAETLPVGTYTYSVVATDKIYPGYISPKVNIDVTSHEKPEIEIAGNKVYCEVPATVILEAQGEHTGSTFRWFIDGEEITPGGTAKQLNHPNYIPRPNPYIYSVEVTAPDANGACVSEAQVEVVVNDDIQVSIAEPTVTTVCVGGQVDLHVEDAHLYPGANYIWYRNGIAISTLGLPDFSDIYDTPGTYTYSVSAVINPSCQTPASEPVTITVYAEPTASSFAIGPIVAIPNNTICDGGQFTLHILDENFNYAPDQQYAWYRNGVMISGANLPTLTDSPTSVDQDVTTYTYNLVIISNGVCEMTADYTVTVKRNPIVLLSGASDVCVGNGNVVLSTYIDGTITTPAASGTYRLTRDGILDTTNINNPTFTRTVVPRNNPYVYQVEYVGPNGCSAFSNTLEVTVHNTPQFFISAEENPVCVGGDINLSSTLTDNSTGYTYQWYKNDADGVPQIISGATFPTYHEVATTAGTFRYWLVVTNPDVPGVCRAGAYIDVEVITAPTVSISVNNGITEICDGGQLTLTATPPVNGGIYTWYRNGVIIEGATQAVLYDSPTTVDHDSTLYIYSVSVAQAISGCQSAISQSVNILVKRNPVVELITPPNVCNVDNNVVLSVAVDGATGYIPGYFIYKQDGITQYEEYNEPTHTFIVGPRNYPYAYQVEYIAPNGCNAFSNVAEVMVHERPEIQLFVEETPICVGGDIDLSVTLSNYSISHDYTYQWYTPNTLASNAIPGATLPTYHEVATTPGIHTYWLIVDNYAVHGPATSFRCHTSQSIQVEVRDIPTIELESNVNEICDGGQLELTATVGGGVEGGEIYTWYRNGELLPNAVQSVIFDSPTTVDQDSTLYTYTVVVTQTASGCQSVLSESIEVLVKRNPVVELVSNPNVCVGDNNIVLNTYINGVIDPVAAGTYILKLDGGVDTTHTDYATFTRTGAPRNYPYSYQVEYIAPNGCNAFTNTVEVMVHARPEIELFVEESPICVGGDIDLYVTLGNYSISDEYTYQWYHTSTADTNAIPGATLSTYHEVATVPGTYTYWLIVDNYAVHTDDPGFRCHSQESIEVVVKADPTITLAISDTVICEGGEVVLTATVTGGVDEISGISAGRVYTWYKNDVIVSGALDSIFVDYPETTDGDVTTIIYRVEVTQSASGCASVVTAEQTLEIHPNPTVVISGDPIVCKGDSNITLYANINDDYPTADLDVQWRLFNADIPGADSIVYTGTYADTDNPYIFTVVVSNPLGCVTESAPFAVYVNTPPVVEVTATETEVCVGGEVTLTAHLEDYNAPDLVYRWYANDVEIYGATEATYTTVMDATTLFRVEVDQITSGCNDFDTITITVQDDPFISLTIDESIICEGGEVVLTASVTGGVAEVSGVTGGMVYRWYKNDVLLPEATDSILVDYPVTTDGDITQITYRVEVTQTAAGCASVNTADTTLTIYPNPSVQIEGDPIICDGDSIRLIANVNDEYPGSALTYQWRLFNADILGATDSIYIQHYPDTIDPYIFTVVVSNPNGCVTESAPFYQYVNTTPIVQVTATEVDICEGGEITITAHLADYNADFLTYQWYTVDTAGAETPIHGASEITLTIVPQDTTIYRIRVFQTTSDCEAYGDITINAAEDPTISVAISEPVICEGGEVTLTATVTGGVTGGEVYTWLKNGEIIPEATEAILVDYPVTTDGDITNYTYTVRVVQAAAGCASVVDATVGLIVHPNPTVVISGDPIVCRGDNNITLYANINDDYPTADLDVQWRLFNVDILDADSIVYTDTYADTDNPYIFTVVVSNPLGCITESAPFEVYVNTPPVVEITATENHVCVGGEVTLTAHLEDYNAPDLVYRWFANGTPIYGATEATYTTVMTATTVFRVEVDQITSGCSDFDEFTVTVEADPEIAIDIDESVICEGGEVVLTATITSGGVAGGEVYTWYKNGVLVPGATAATYVDYPVTTDGDITQITYRVEVTQTAAGCASVNTADTTLTIHPNPSVQIEGDPIICDGSPVRLNANVNESYDVSGLSYQWRLFNADIEGANDSIYTFTYPDTDNPYIFTVVVTNANGCVTESAPFYQYVNTAPVVQVTATETEICTGGEVTLTAHLGDYNSPNLVYQWYTVVGSTETPIHGASEATLTIIPNGTTLYRVEVIQTISACRATGDITITEYPDPVITDITISEDQICSGGQVTVTANTINVIGTPTYTWYRNGILLPEVTTAVFTESPLAIDGDVTVYTYSAFVTTDVAGCQSDVVESPLLTVYDNPVVVISGDANICETDSVFLTAFVDHVSDPVGILSYTWFESGQTLENTAYGVNVPHSQNLVDYFAPRYEPYVFTVRVTRDNGCTTLSDPFELYVHESPVVNITATETAVCEGGEVTMTANLDDYNTEMITYQWYTESYHTYPVYSDPVTFEMVTDTLMTLIPGATQQHYTTVVDETTAFYVRVLQTHSLCEKYDRIVIDVIPTPVVTEITVSDPAICEGGQVTLTAVTDPADLEGAVYTWYRNGALIDGVPGASFTDSPLTVDNDLTTYEYSVSVSVPVAGCASDIFTATQLVTVYGNPTVVIEGNPIVCEDSLFTLIANVNDTIPGTTVTYQWRRFNEDIPGATGSTLTTSEPFEFGNTYMYTVVVNTEYTNGTIGCVRESEPFYVVVGENPIVEIIATDTVACEGGQVTLTAVLGNPYLENISVTWYRNGEVIYGAHGLTYTATITETSTFYAVISANGCTATTEEITITLIPTPAIGAVVAYNTVGGSDICEGGEVEVTAYLEGPAGNYIDSTATYTWYRNGFLMPLVTGPWFRESLHAIDGDTTHYTYSVIVTSESVNCVSTMGYSNTVTVIRNPIVIINGNHEVCQANGNTPNVYLSAYINGISNPDTTTIFKWYKNGVYQENPSFQLYYTEVLGLSYQTVEYMLEVINGNGCSAFSEPFEVFVHPNPVVNITTDDTVVCVGGQVTLQGNLNDYNEDEYVFQWYRNGISVNHLIPGATQLIYTTPPLTTSGTYYLRVIQRNTGCVDFDTKHIHVVADPVIDEIQVSATEVCTGAEVTVTAVTSSVTGTAVYTWYRNGQLVPGATGPVLTQTLYALGGDQSTYTYAATVRTELSGCESSLVTAPVITVNNDPHVVIAGEPIVCEGANNIVLYANAVPSTGMSYQWYLNNVAITGATDATLTTTQPASTTPYTYSVSVSGAPGCGAVSATFDVLVNAAPNVAVSVDAATICAGGEVTFTATIDNWNLDMLTYQWYHDGVLIPGATNLTYTATIEDVAIHTYSIIVDQLTSGCSGTAQATVSVVADPVIDAIQVSATEICNGAEVTVTAVTSNITGTPVYTWYRNGQIVVGATGSVLTETLYAEGGDQSTYTYAATVSTDLSGCESSLATAPVITVTNDPHVVIAGEPIVCAGENNIVLHANSVPSAGMSYQWYLNNVAITGATDATLVTTQPASTTPYTYSVLVSGAPGCDVLSATFDVLVNDAPIVAVSSDAAVICEGGEVTFTATIDNWNLDMLTYQWYHDGVLIPGATNLTYTTTIDVVADHTYSIVVNQLTSGCSGTAQATVSVVADPVITSIDISEAFICDGGQITITANAVGVVGTPIYTWYRNGELIEGVTGAQFLESPLAVDGDATTYTYSAIVTSTISGCNSAMVTSSVLTVYANPVVGITGDAHICEDVPVNLMAFVDHVSDPVGNLTYTWFESGQQRDNLVNGIPVNSQIYLEYWYPSDQPYVFTVRVTRDNGCTTLSDPFYVYVHEKPVVNITANAEEVCEGGEVTLTANLDDYNTSNITYQWFTQTIVEQQVQISPTDFITVYDTIITNIPGATTQTYTTLVDATTVYGVLVNQTISGCTATDLITITATTIPVVTEIVVTPSTVICDGGQITLTAITTGGVAGGEHYTWYRNGIVIEGANTATLIESPQTVDGDVTLYTYNVTVAQSASACESVLDSAIAVVITVNPNPTVAISGDPIICDGNLIELFANLNDTNNNTGLTYDWRLFNTSLGITTQDLSITRPASDNPYIFTVVVTNEYGCQAVSDPYYVYVNANPTVVVTATESTICEGGSTTLTANLGDYNVPYLVYQWTADGVVILGATTSTLTVTPTATTVYGVSVVQTNSACQVTGTYTITVVPAPVIASVTISETEICEGGQVTVTATVAGGISGGEVFTWYRNGVVIPNATGASFTESPLEIGGDVTVYTYTVQVSQTGSGCESAISSPVSVTVYPTATVQIAVTGSTTICEGGSVVLSANVNPTTTNTTYQWFVDNVLIPGATDQTYQQTIDMWYWLL
ncbi:MAG TPA: hypothetical protein PK471_00100, partial [Bacteroidales bacterium]|nr:hypothetical protein [Bacteroidales bacterium]